MKNLTFAAALAACLPLGVWAAGAADNIAVVDPYVRMVPPGAMATAAFMVLKNAGDKDVKLVKAESSAAKITELHTHLNEGGVMKMRQVPAIAIKAKGEATLQPGGLHVMMIDLKAPLKEGDKVAVTLGFDDGSSKKIEAPIRKPAPMPAMDHSKH
ncbi:MAG: copper chaperone PCu(A)C [Rhodocyclales bacterium]|nr:copper chaperone PCu(A)C [Rhodocyclales bacterium]MBI5784809.1 copper chaperone PCu(A)C [Rhodocyclales bacterium]